MNASSCNKVQNGYFSDLDVIWKGFMCWVCMANMKALLLMDQKLWQKLKFLDMQVKGHGQGH